jgi:hypothetical protein
MVTDLPARNLSKTAPMLRRAAWPVDKGIVEEIVVCRRGLAQVSKRVWLNRSVKADRMNKVA